MYRFNTGMCIASLLIKSDFKYLGMSTGFNSKQYPVVWLLLESWATGTQLPGQLFPLTVSNSLHHPLFHSSLSQGMVRAVKEHIPTLAMAGVARGFCGGNPTSHLVDRDSGQGCGSWQEILPALKYYQVIKKHPVKKGCNCKWSSVWTFCFVLNTFVWNLTAFIAFIAARISHNGLGISFEEQQQNNNNEKLEDLDPNQKLS